MTAWTIPHKHATPVGSSAHAWVNMNGIQPTVYELSYVDYEIKPLKAFSDM